MDTKEYEKHLAGECDEGCTFCEMEDEHEEMDKVASKHTALKRAERFIKRI